MLLAVAMHAKRWDNVSSSPLFKLQIEILGYIRLPQKAEFGLVAKDS